MAIEQRISEKLAAAQLSVKNTPAVPEPEQTRTAVPSCMGAMEEARTRMDLLQEFVRTMMVEGQDYGIVPGSRKPSLLKPGAEKLCDLFGFSKIVTILSRVENWDAPFLHYEVKVTLIHKSTGAIEAEGIGSCNSKEKKFLHQDTWTVANTLLKMAKKRALVDAVLSATRSSGLFTQDLEELDLRPQSRSISPATQEATPLSPEPKVTKPIRLATDPQLRKILALSGELNISREALSVLIQKRYRAKTSRELSLAAASDLIQYLVEQQK